MRGTEKNYEIRNFVITEKYDVRVIGDRERSVWEYYINGEFIFGTLQVMAEEDLLALCDNGYFDSFLWSIGADSEGNRG